MTQKHSQFKPLEVGLIVIAMVVILFSGYKIYDSKRGGGSAATPTQASDDSQDDISLTTTWQETTSHGGSFSMKIPDGWNVTNYASGKEVTDQIAGTNLTYAAGQKAIVTNKDVPLQSAIRPYGLGTEFNMFILNKKYDYKVATSDTVKSSSKAVTRGGLSGQLTTTQYGAATTADVPQNQTEYVYTFPLPSDKTLVASYVQKEGAPDQTKYFEQAVRTIQVIK